MTRNTPKVLLAVNPKARPKSSKKCHRWKTQTYMCGKSAAPQPRIQHQPVKTSFSHCFHPVCLLKHTFCVFSPHKRPEGTIWWKQLQLLTELVSVWTTLTSAARDEYQRVCLHHFRLTGDPTRFSAEGNRFELAAPQQPPPFMAIAALHDKAVFFF